MLLLFNVSYQYFLLPQMSNVADELPYGPADLPSCLWIMYSTHFNSMKLAIIVFFVTNTVLVAYTADEVEYKWLEGASPVGYEGELQLSQVMNLDFILTPVKCRLSTDKCYLLKIKCHLLTKFGCRSSSNCCIYQYVS